MIKFSQEDGIYQFLIHLFIDTVDSVRQTGERHSIAVVHVGKL